MAKHTERFSNRVEQYVRYRPGYPESMFQYLRDHSILKDHSVVVDMGSGTGISSLPFLERGHTVFTVEPNAAMRNSAEEMLAGYAGFHSIAATAESCSLPDHTAQLIVCAQAFHWFDRVAARKEFRRVLQPSGYCLMIWNERLVHTDFLRAYENALLQYSPDYHLVDHRKINIGVIKEFCSPFPVQEVDFSNEQLFNREALKGRLESSSYCPVEKKAYQAIMKRMDELYEQFAEEGLVRFMYKTKLFLSRWD